MIIHLIDVDRRAALLAGYELPARPTMEASPKDFGDDWPAVLNQLRIANDGSATLPLTVTAPTVEGVIVAVKAENAKAERDWMIVRALAEAALVDYAAATANSFDQLPSSTITVYDTTEGGFAGPAIGTILAVAMPRISEPSLYDTRVRDEHRQDQLFERLHEAKRELEARIATENKARADAARPGLRAEWAAKEEARKTALREKEAAEEATIAARAAERLATGYWERETGPYNERRYSKPWCARVTGVETAAKSRGHLIYEFQEWNGRHGQSGLLRSPCQPGDIIAWGQKDHRGNKDDHIILQMQPDGRMVSLSVPEAAKVLRAAAKDAAP
jgi:hypothetical protein